MALSGAERQRAYRNRNASLRYEKNGILLEVLAELNSLRDAVTLLSSLLNGSPLGSPLDSLPTPLLNPPPRILSKSVDDDFDRWWQAYPEKIGKGAARRAFKTALTKTSLDQLESGLARYKASKPADRPWCNPATWLNQERWNDVITNGHDSKPFASSRGAMYGPVEDPTEIAKRLGLTR